MLLGVPVIAAMEVLGASVSADLARRWREWFAPDVQPFVVNDVLRASLPADRAMDLPLELQDTFLLYGEATLAQVVGLTRSEFDGLTDIGRAALVRHQVVVGRRVVPTLKSVPTQWRSGLKRDGDGHRFVWWPDSLSRCGDEPLRRFVTDDLVSSRQALVSQETWSRAAPLLPAAQAVAGTFAYQSGPNCFGTVMAAAGVVGADSQWMLREPFEDWLRSATRPGGADHDAGTVLIWRDRGGSLQHAAVTIGDGWAMHKPSQGWMTPRKVLTVDEVKRRSRRAGLTLARRSLRRIT